MELISPVTLSYGNFNLFLWILKASDMCSVNSSVFPGGQRREVFVMLVLVVGFPYTLRRRRRWSWWGLCYSSRCDSSSSSQRKSRRIWEGSCWVQDLRKQPSAKRTSKLRFLWSYWFWDICLREGNNGVSIRTRSPSSSSSLISEVWTDLSLEGRLEGLQLQRKQPGWRTKGCKTFFPHFWLLQFENAKKIRTETGQYCRCIGYGHTVMGYVMNFLLKFWSIYFVF